MSNTAIMERNGNGLVARSHGLPSGAQWETICGMADALLQSGLLPAHIKTWQAAAAIVQKGTELGIPPMYALSNVVVIQGKPVANAELMLALVYRDHGDGAVYFEESNANRCILRYKRRGWDAYKETRFTIDDAKTAGLLSNATWQKYPAAMLRARAISAMARLAFPDSIAGMYSPDELGSPVTVDSDGVVNVAAVDTDTGEIRPQSLPAPQPAAAPDFTTIGIGKRTMDALHAKAPEKGMSHTDLHIYATDRFNVSSMNDLTEAQGREIANFMKGLPDVAQTLTQDSPAAEPESPAVEYVSRETLDAIASEGVKRGLTEDDAVAWANDELAAGIERAVQLTEYQGGKVLEYIKSQPAVKAKA